MVQSFVGNVADMAEFFSSKMFQRVLYHADEGGLAFFASCYFFGLWNWTSLQFCFSYTPKDDFQYNVDDSTRTPLDRIFIYLKRTVRELILTIISSLCFSFGNTVKFLFR